jgi:XTP/dITP diphosphohydrolase
VLVATSNAGKLRDFAGAAALQGVTLLALPNFTSIPAVVEDGATFEENAVKKAAHYSGFAPGEIVIADDSGLEVIALAGAPGVLSARYAAAGSDGGNASDQANNARLLAELAGKNDRRARFVCVIAAAREGRLLGTFRGHAEGIILQQARGAMGFGYDPLFYVPALGKSFAELAPEEKAAVSHRGHAFSEFLSWYDTAVR